MNNLKKYPESSYANIPTELIARSAIQLVDELPKQYLDRPYNYEGLVNLTILQLRFETVRSYRKQLKKGIKCDMFMYYLHNFSLAKDSLLYEAVVGEIKVRKLASIL